MKTLTVGEFKQQFSEALDAVRHGETVVVAYGRRCTKVAAMIPFTSLRVHKKRKLGALQSTATMKIRRDFVLTDIELLSS
jgi:antitoxin (DNA-binding transcriptional repressor) of toxin-antitoxin stability system